MHQYHKKYMTNFERKTCFFLYVCDARLSLIESIPPAINNSPQGGDDDDDMMTKASRNSAGRSLLPTLERNVLKTNG